MPRPSPGHSCPSASCSAASSLVDVFSVIGLFRVGMTASFLFPHCGLSAVRCGSLGVRMVRATALVVCFVLPLGDRRRIPLLRPVVIFSLSLSAASFWLITSSQKEVIASLLLPSARSALIRAAALLLESLALLEGMLRGIFFRAAMMAGSRLLCSYSLQVLTEASVPGEYLRCSIREQRGARLGPLLPTWQDGSRHPLSCGPCPFQLTPPPVPCATKSQLFKIS